jgi:beta-galactosidase
LALTVAVGSLFFACSGAATRATGGGGSASFGGVPATGGVTGTGGTSSSGGISAGGKSAAGGFTTAGGATVAGGGTTSGGRTGTGGATSGGQTGAGGLGKGGSTGSTGGVIGPVGGQTGGPRIVQNFNQAWKFYLGDKTGAEASTYDDSSWSNVGLPHTFSMPYFMWKNVYYGYGWYRKHLNVPAEWSGKRVFIEFQASFQDTQVYVNGKQVGRHLGGYNGFSYDITSSLQSGDNVIAVRINNNYNAQVAPRNGDHTFDGGIYRNLYIVVTDPLHVTWYGTFVTTPTLETNSGSSSTVNVTTEIRNDRSASVNCTLKTDIVDSSGAVVGSKSSSQAIPAGTTVTFDQTTNAINKPALWSLDHPTLYRAVSTLSDDSGTVDSFSTTFGFRWINWSATSGFSLNGTHVYFHGANVHQDHAGWGNAVTDTGFYRDVKMVKDAGLNFIRGSHYPKAPAFSDACDQLGVLFWSENCFWGSAAYGEGSFQSAGAYPGNAADKAPFDQSVQDSLTDMIRIHRNHPSIVAWSMGNEVYFTASVSDAAALLKKVVALTHTLDPTRPAAIGGVQRPNDSTRIDKIGDVAGYNGDGATISMFQNPGIPNVVAEHGSVSASRPGNYDPGWGDLASQLSGGVPNEFAWRSGQAVWCMFDHGTQKDAAYGTMGIVDYFRIPKRAWYWYRNQYAKVAPPTWPTAGAAAALKLSASTTTLGAVDGTQDAQVLVSIVDATGKQLSNTAAVTLTIKSGPGEFPTGTKITFSPPSTDPQSDIVIRDGQAAIEFRSYYAGTTVIEATSSGLTSDSITITSQGTPAYVDGTTPPVADRPYKRY